MYRNPILVRQEAGALMTEAETLLEVMKTRSLNQWEEQRVEFISDKVDNLLRKAEKLEDSEGFRGVSKPQGSRNGGSTAYTQRTADAIEPIFCRWLRNGDHGAEAEIRAYNNTDMNVTTAADGEVAVPVGMVNDIKARRDESMLASKLGVENVPGKGTTVNYPIDAEGDVLFTAVSESGTINQDAPALSEKAFTLVKYGKHVTLTWELLRDEDASLMKFINNWVARGWAGTHNSLLVTEVLANGTAGLTLDAATAIGAAEIPELVGKLQPEYRDSAQWLMHQNTFSYLQSIASSSVFTFAPTPNGNPNGSLWGYPVNESSYMTALGASIKSLVYGNFNFLGMREGTGLTMLRDPYTAAGSGQVKIYFWFDAVYGVLQAEAIQYGTHATA